jgi:hypothetical protein
MMRDVRSDAHARRDMGLHRLGTVTLLNSINVREKITCLGENCTPWVRSKPQQLLKPVGPSVDGFSPHSREWSLCEDAWRASGQCVESYAESSL